MLAHTEGAPVAAMADESRKLYGVVVAPEVKHSRLARSLSASCTVCAALCPTAGMPPRLSRIRVRRSAREGRRRRDLQLSGVIPTVATTLVSAHFEPPATSSSACSWTDLLRKGREIEQVKHDFVADRHPPHRRNRRRHDDFLDFRPSQTSPAEHQARSS